ncbi:hypothetical protein [Paraburkholderia bryophila]|uniref:Uncharacterized protein n=1 Tax=Paraburkholderia bryophila TaxID=420952 RepID=A0A7Z0AXH4_9BURK|nr:hypothetical protein [Paraburkholderia bryophila]NYH13459.1 hypothetical protein [Paraburkholderia bryophila]
MSQEEKTLVIGVGRFQSVETVAWGDILDTNIVDFDNIIVDLTMCDFAPLLAQDEAAFAKLQTSFARFISSGGELTVIGTDSDRTYGTADGSIYDDWSWCPCDVRTVAESGTTVRRLTGEFEQYLSHLTTWAFHFKVGDGAKSPLAKAYGRTKEFISTSVVPYAENRYGGLLACQIEFSVFVNIGQDFANLAGRIILLPTLPGLDSESAVSLALEGVTGNSQEKISVEVSLPAWIAAVHMPVIDPIDTRVALLRSEILACEAEIEQKLSEKSAYERYKGLLYLNSFGLEDLVAECLTRLSGVIKPAKYSQEEFVLEHKNGVFLAECKGVSKSISMGHLRQLVDYVLKYEEEEGCAGKGILFGNAWRDLPLDERGTGDRPIFPQNVQVRARTLGIALVSTVDLFDAFCAFLSGRVTGDAVLEWMTNAVGVADVSALQLSAD